MYECNMTSWNCTMFLFCTTLNKFLQVSSFTTVVIYISKVSEVPAPVGYALVKAYFLPFSSLILSGVSVFMVDQLADSNIDSFGSIRLQVVREGTHESVLSYSTLTDHYSGSTATYVDSLYSYSWLRIVHSGESSLDMPDAFFSGTTSVGLSDTTVHFLFFSDSYFTTLGLFTLLD